MHYKNGRGAAVGDRVVSRDYNGNPVSGIVIACNSEADTCNLQVLPVEPTKVLTLTAKECLHLGDAMQD